MINNYTWTSGTGSYAGANNSRNLLDADPLSGDAAGEVVFSTQDSFNASSNKSLEMSIIFCATSFCSSKPYQCTSHDCG